MTDTVASPTHSRERHPTGRHQTARPGQPKPTRPTPRRNDTYWRDHYVKLQKRLALLLAIIVLMAASAVVGYKFGHDHVLVRVPRYHVITISPR